MRHKPHYLDLSLIGHLDDVAQDSTRSRQRLWWLIAGLTLLAVFLIGVGVTGGIW